LERARALLADPGDLTISDIQDFIALSSAREEAERKEREEALERDKTFLDALRSTLASSGRDSPVFELLPRLKPHDRQALMGVPWDFHEAVEHAQKARLAGDLRLLAEEARGFDWGSGGLRLVGEAQFGIMALAGAKETFEAFLRLDPNDLQANYRL